MERKTIALGTYGGDSWYKDHSDCMNALRLNLGVEVMELRGCIYIALARSVLATAALDHGADVVVFIDHDIIFDPNDVLVIADEARDCKGIVAAPYSMRRMGAGVVAGLTPDTGEITFGKGGGLYPVSWNLGMGFTAIHREVFDKVAFALSLETTRTLFGPCVPYFEQIKLDGFWHLEDASFCYKAHTAGVPCFTDTRINILHRGTHDFRIADAAKKHAEEPGDVKLRTR